MLITNRQKEIVELLSKGYTRKDISKKLFIGEETVKSHIRNVRMKNYKRNVAHLVADSIREGIID